MWVTSLAARMVAAVSAYAITACSQPGDLVVDAC
jgi:hypothetical protein